MVQIIKRVTRGCNGCMGASFGDCDTCEKVVDTEIVQCHNCKYKSKNVEWRNNPSAIMCELLHAWVKPTDFCAWGEENKE